MIIHANDCWRSAKADHAAYFDRLVNKRLKRHKKKITNRIYEFLKGEHDNIRDGSIDDFKRIQILFEGLLGQLGGRTQKVVLKYIPKIYNYDALVTNKASDWDAFKLCERSAIQTCPYCNLKHQPTLQGAKKRIRPTLDHFFNRARYPIYSISLGNLIPTCSDCNSILKNDLDFRVNEHLNPLEDGERMRIILDVDPVAVAMDISKLDSAPILILVKSPNDAAINSLETFEIDRRYAAIEDEARTIARGLRGYKNDVVDSMVVLEGITRGVTADNYRNKPLGRMILDLYKEYAD